MKKSELIQTEDYNTFAALTDECKLSDTDKALCIRARWNYLYDKYRPSREHIEARKRFNKREGGKRHA